MRVIKNIHNNISLCLDSKGNEVVAFGKGIGFKKPPYDLPITSVERTFYNVNPAYIDMLIQIPEEIIEISSLILDYANDMLNGMYSTNLIFTLADHICFSIKRYKENIHIKLPLVHEVKHMYPKEIEIGYYALALIKEYMHIELPKDEAAVITLHVLEYGLNCENEQGMLNNQTKIEKSVEIVEECMDVHINKEGFHYSRFASHMYFLLDRVQNNASVKSENKKMFRKLVEEYPKTYECSKKIAEILAVELNDEELMYLILHINRLSSREEMK